jgi:hypothetical protein
MSQFAAVFAEPVQLHTIEAVWELFNGKQNLGGDQCCLLHLSIHGLGDLQMQHASLSFVKRGWRVILLSLKQLQWDKASQYCRNSCYEAKHLCCIQVLKQSNTLPNKPSPASAPTTEQSSTNLLSTSSTPRLAVWLHYQRLGGKPHFKRWGMSTMLHRTMPDMVRQQKVDDIEAKLR